MDQKFTNKSFLRFSLWRICVNIYLKFKHNFKNLYQDQLDDSTKKIFGRTVERLLNCAKSKMIGFSTRDLTAKFHKNSRQFGATLWGAVLDDDGHTNLSTAFELMLAAALKQKKNKTKKILTRGCSRILTLIFNFYNFSEKLKF